MAFEQINPTTWKTRLPSGDQIEVGDASSGTFKPHIKLNRWGGECSIGIGYPTLIRKAPVVSGDKIT